MSASERPETPYVGLIPYSEKDAPFFFGRERERKLIAASLIASRLTLLYGPSGVGKSSVLRAGVLPHLRQLAERRGGREGKAKLAYTIFSSWSSDPVTNLLKAAESAVKESLKMKLISAPGPTGVKLNSVFRPTEESKRAVADYLKLKSLNLISPELSLAENLQRLTEPLADYSARKGDTKQDQPEANEEGKPEANDSSVKVDLLIILDQFEEFFLYPRKEGERSLAEELPPAVNQTNLRVNFLISVREDLLHSLDRFKVHIPDLFDNFLRIKHLDRKAGRSAIEEPVKQYNKLYANGHPITPQSALVEEVLNQVKAGQGFLGGAGRGKVETPKGDADSETKIETSYLQLVMTRLWREEAAVHSQALQLETLDRLGGAKSIVETHLVDAMRALTPEEQEVAAHAFHYLVTPSGTKIAYTAFDLARQAKIDKGDIERVLEKLLQSKVRILRAVDPSPERPNEPRYEIFHDALAPAILNWGKQFESVQKWIKGNEPLERDRRRVMQLRLALFAILSIVILLFSVWYFSGEAHTQKNVALSRELAWTASKLLPDDPDLSLSLALQAVNYDPNKQAEESLRNSLGKVLKKDFNLDSCLAFLKGSKGYMTNVVFTPDGKFIINADNSGTRICSLTTGQLMVLENSEDLEDKLSYKIKFSLDGKTLVIVATDYSANDSVVRIWNASNLAASKLTDFRKLPSQGYINTVAVNSDGQLIATAMADRLVIWYPATAQIISELPQSDVHSIAFSPDGKHLVAGGSQGARIWDWWTKDKLADLSWSKINSVSYSPDGNLIVTAGNDPVARVWDAKTGRNIRELQDPNDVGKDIALESAAFSADGRLILTVSTFYHARVWGWPVREEGDKYVPLPQDAYGAIFSPDGKFILAPGRGAIYTRESFVPLPELVRMATERARPLTEQERIDYLHRRY